MFRQFKLMYLYSRYRFGAVVIFICLLGVYLFSKNTYITVPIWRSSNAQHSAMMRNETALLHWENGDPNTTASTRDHTGVSDNGTVASEANSSRFAQTSDEGATKISPFTSVGVEPAAPDIPAMTEKSAFDPFPETPAKGPPEEIPPEKSSVPAAPPPRPPARKTVASTAVVNPHNFNYLIRNGNKCRKTDGSDRDLFFVIFVTSIHAQYDRRKAIRNTWATERVVGGKNVELLFVLAKTKDKRLQDLLVEEALTYGDIIQEDFVDAYRNLTLKTMFIMKWIKENCRNARYAMKTDDDMYIQVASIVEFLKKQPTSSFMSGQVVNGKPIRNPKSKWYMPKTSYTRDKYPPFCAGPGYVFSTDMAEKILDVSYTLPYLYLEDVFVALCNEALHITPVTNKNFHNSLVKFKVCDYKRMFSSHRVRPEQMYSYYKQIINSHVKC